MARMPEGAVGAGLFADAQVHREVQKGVGLAGLGREFRAEGALPVVEQRVILGVLADQGDQCRLERLQRLAAAALLPGLDELLA